jgi:integrase
MKAHREHRVPLSPRAVARQTDDGNSYVFAGPKPGTALSNMALLMLLRRMGIKDLTVHGFRATFKTWASECTSTQNEVVEAALAHIVGNRVEQAYRRGDLFEKRRRLIQQWANFCTTIQARQENAMPFRLKT